MIIPMFDFRKYVIANFGLTGTGHVRFSGAFGVEEWSPEDVNTFTRKLLCWTISNPIADALQMVADAGDDPSCYTNLIFYCRKKPNISQLRLIDDTLLMGLCVNLHNDPYNLVTIAGTVLELAHTMRGTPHNYKELFVNYVIKICKDLDPMKPRDPMIYNFREYMVESFMLSDDLLHRFTNAIIRKWSSEDEQKFADDLLTWTIAQPVAAALEKFTGSQLKHVVAKCRGTNPHVGLLWDIVDVLPNDNVFARLCNHLHDQSGDLVTIAATNHEIARLLSDHPRNFATEFIEHTIVLMTPERFKPEPKITTATLCDIFGDTVPVAALMIMEGWQGSHANLMSILNRLAPLELEIGTDDALSHPYDIATERERNRCLAIVQLYMPDGSPLRNLITEAIETGKPV